MISSVLAVIASLIWLYLLACRGGFWRAAVRDDVAPGMPVGSAWPSVTAIMPARNESAVIEVTLAALLGQRYGGELKIVLVDDRSDDDTARIARGVVERYNACERVTILPGAALPDGWTGKVWALQQGIAELDREHASPEFVFFTDADIRYEHDALSRVVARAETEGLVLTSIMATLRCVSPAERWAIPAFIFFFQMLYPFAYVKRADRATAAAAGGCMLVRRSALAAAGGLQSIRSALIDDCALARKLKQVGPIWLGLSERVTSIRAYPNLADIQRMIARTAYAQLRFSPVLLAVTATAMTLSYTLPPVVLGFGSAAAKPFALFAWLTMAVMFQPTLRFYRASPWYGMALPAIAMLYLVFTLRSAYEHLRGRGGAWKGRTYGAAASRS
jgi:hopene-associated glycosyltransferase HpnB